jgi:hypothetical protein
VVCRTLLYKRLKFCLVSVHVGYLVCYVLYLCTWAVWYVTSCICTRGLFGMLRPVSVHVGCLVCYVLYLYTWAVYLHHYVASGTGRLPARKPACAGIPGSKFSRLISDTVLRVFNENLDTSFDVV